MQFASIVFAFPENSYDTPSHGIEVITRDVAIIGGGSTGTYAAFKLIDEKHSVVVVEAKSRLGGHTETYHDPDTGATIDIGVVVWHNLDLVKKYFARFNIPLINFGSSFQPETVYFEAATGKAAVSYIPPSPAKLGAALQVYTTQLLKYTYLSAGLFLPNPVPPDLFISIGEFIKKYKLDAMVQLAFGYAQGSGDFLKVPTLYLASYFGLEILQGLQTGFLTTARGDNSELYEAATRELAASGSVLLKTTVVHADRNKRDKDGYLSIIVSSADCPRPKLIRAKQLLITIPPTLSNLAPFNLDTPEKEVFSKLTYETYITGLINNTGIAPNIGLTNVNPANPYGLPDLPAVYSFGGTIIPGLASFKYGGPLDISDEAAKKDILNTLKKLEANGLVKGNPEIVAYSNHKPFWMKVGSDEIAKGFYAKMYGLQGRRGTWWTGGAWFVHDSSMLWRFTEGVLAELVKKL